MIRPFQPGTGRDEDVGRLHVSVDEAPGVSRLERSRDLRDEGDDLLRLQPAALLQPRLQVGAVDVAHRDVEDPVLAASLVDRDDVRMLERGGDLRLALEALAEVLVVAQPG